MAKADLVFPKPFLNAASTLGWAPDFRTPIPWDDLGAFITNPISWRPRSVAEQPACLEYPGGFLLHTGLPNPGFSKVVARCSGRWAKSTLPIIVHIMGDRPEESAAMVRQLETLENILAVELGFAPLLADDILVLAIERSQGELPLIACLPPDQFIRLGPRTLQAGAAAISLAAPRGTLPRAGALIQGRLFGPGLFPESFRLIQTAAKLGLPCIGACGISSLLDAQAMIDAGALAAKLDVSLWLPKEYKRTSSQ
jgi:dihydroorotate dehydrogenase